MKRNFTILIVLFFIFSFSSCSSDDNGDLKKAEQEQQQKEDETAKELEEDFTSEEYIKSILLGRWISTEISNDGTRWQDYDGLDIEFNKDDTYAWRFDGSTIRGEYSIFPANDERDSVGIVLDNSQIILMISYEDGVIKGYTMLEDMDLMFFIERQ